MWPTTFLSSSQVMQSCSMVGNFVEVCFTHGYNLVIYAEMLFGFYKHFCIEECYSSFVYFLQQFTLMVCKSLIWYLVFNLAVLELVIWKVYQRCFCVKLLCTQTIICLYPLSWSLLWVEFDLFWNFIIQRVKLLSTSICIQVGAGTGMVGIILACLGASQDIKSGDN